MRDHVRVTRIDENGPAIVVDAAARERLSVALDRGGVVAAMLFGSQATGKVGPLSDVDVAVWADPALDPSRRFDLRLELMGEASRALHTDESTSSSSTTRQLCSRTGRCGTRSG